MSKAAGGNSMTTYQFEVDDEEWAEWKRQVPRDKALHVRLRELMQADVDGRVSEPREEPEPSAEPPGRPEEHVGTEPPVDVIDQVVEEAAEGWDDRNSRLESRKEAAKAVLRELRERPMSKSEIVDEMEPEYPVENQSARTWWRKNLSEDGPLKRVARYNASSQKWEWVGEE